ncbi:uncharacterized protein [Primulina eburnea]|uniref:uncharacterized protein n=1 Tax=Primulina eburnea TaxID=1245227 RepID=UPI003C6C2AF1
MEIDTKISHFNEERPKGNCTRVNEPNTPVDIGAKTSVFINQGATKWEEIRKKWVGDQSQKPAKVPKDPILSWSLTYDDLLSTNDPFSEPIPLPEMVDFLVDIWHDEGLYD